MSVPVDTNVLLRRTQPSHENHTVAVESVAWALGTGELRQALLAVASQSDFMTAVAGDPKNWRVCPSFFTRGAPMANNAGSEALTGKRVFAKAEGSSPRPDTRARRSSSWTRLTCRARTNRRWSSPIC
jgi:hypothetical protein